VVLGFQEKTTCQNHHTCFKLPMGTVGNGRFLQVTEPRQKPKYEKTKGGPGLGGDQCCLAQSSAAEDSQFFGRATCPAADASCRSSSIGPNGSAAAVLEQGCPATGSPWIQAGFARLRRYLRRSCATVEADPPCEVAVSRAA